MDYSKVSVIDRRTIRYENIILAEIERELQTDNLRSLIPGLLRIPEAIFELDEVCQSIQTPWLLGGEVDDRDYDQLYYDNIGRFLENENEKTD